MQTRTTHGLLRIPLNDPRVYLAHLDIQILKVRTVITMAVIYRFADAQATTNFRGEILVAMLWVLTIQLLVCTQSKQPHAATFWIAAALWRGDIW